MPKVKVDGALVKKVAENARLSLSEAEVKKFTPQLKDVLEYFSMVDKLDVSNEEPSFQPVKIKNVMREDTPGKCLSQDEALSNSQHKKNGYFKGPGVMQ